MAKDKKKNAAAQDAPVRTKKKSALSEFWRMFKKRKISVVGLVVVFILIFCAVLAEFVAPYDYAEQDLRQRFTYPCWEHPLGTDNFGRDLLSRIIFGGRVSLLVALVSICTAVLVGGSFGATAGYFGGLYESIIMRCMDAIMAVPALLYAVAISASLGTGIVSSTIAIAFGFVPTFTRVARAAVLTVREQEYIEAAKAIGASSGRIIVHHIIPNAMAPCIVQATVSLVNSILTISTLSFIGLGVQPPTPEWGSILANGREYIREFWPLATFPGVAIMICLISFNMVGDGVRDALDPRLKQ